MAKRRQHVEQEPSSSEASDAPPAEHLPVEAALVLAVYLSGKSDLEDNETALLDRAKATIESYAVALVGNHK